MEVLCLLLSLLLVTDLSCAQNPGFAAKITTRALDYASKQATIALANTVANYNIPDQEGSSGHVSYSLRNIRLKSFTAPGSTINLVPGRGLTWTASNAGVSLHTDWHVKYKLGIIKASASGSLDASASGVSFSASVAVGSDADGRPSVSSSGCNCAVKSVNIKFHGGLVSTILNIFRGAVDHKVKDLIPGKLCDLVKEKVNVDAEAVLKKLLVTVDLVNVFTLDYRMIRPPLFQTDYMETYHKGEITWKASRQSPPFTPASMPQWPAADSMVYLGLSEYAAQSLAYAAQHYGFLQYVFTEMDLPAAQRSLLSTTCLERLCIGQTIPLVRERYPNSKVELRVRSTKMPEFSMKPGNLSALLSGDITFLAHSPDGQVSSMLTLNLTVGFSANARITNQFLTGEISGTHFWVDLASSNIGNLNTDVINALANLALEYLVIPQINKKGKDGFPLPGTDEIKLINSKVNIVNGGIMVATDVQFAPQF